MKEFGVTVLALFAGFIVARFLSDLIAKAHVPIATGNIGKVPIGAGTASGIRPSS